MPGNEKSVATVGQGDLFPSPNTAQTRAILFLKRVLCRLWELKGATSRFAHVEKFSPLDFSNSSFKIRVNLLYL